MSEFMTPKKHWTGSESVRKLIIAGTLVLLFFSVGVVGYMIIGEGRWSALDCAYMTVITLTTVGYGEVLDISHAPGGKVFTMFLILGGMGTILFFISSLTAFIVEGQFKDLLWRRKMAKSLQRIDGHIIICGLGETGFHVASECVATQTPCVLVDFSEERLQHACDMLDYEIPYIVGDASDDEVLRAAGVERARGLIAAGTDDKDNLFIIVSAKTLNSGLRIVTKAITMQSERKLRRAGADKVVTTNFLGGMRLASEMLRPTVTNFMDRMLKQDAVMRLEEVDILPNSRAADKSLIELDLRKKMNLTIVAIEIKNERKYNFNPEGGFVLKPGMTLICLGEVPHINKLREWLKPK